MDMTTLLIIVLPGYLYDRDAVVTPMPLSELMERARQSPGQGRGPVARLLAAHSGRRAFAVGFCAEVGRTYEFQAAISRRLDRVVASAKRGRKPKAEGRRIAKGLELALQ